MRCGQCGASWSVSQEVQSTLTRCPFCGAELTPPVEKKFNSTEEVLQEIIRLHGVDVLRNASRTISFFCDLAPHMYKERRVLRYFLDCNGAQEMLELKESSETEQHRRCEQIVLQMQEELFVAEKAARSICHSFWVAVYGTPKGQEERTGQGTNLDGNNVTPKPLNVGESEIHVSPVVGTFKATDFQVVDHTLVRYSGFDEEVRVPAGVVRIGENACKGNSNVRKVILPDSVTEIGDAAFSNCVNLQQIFLPKDLQKIGAKSFSGCFRLWYVDLPANLKNIGEQAFFGCAALVSMRVPGGVEGVSQGCFAFCTSLRTVVLEEGIYYIDQFAFDHCSFLQYIRIPDTMQNIVEHVFDGCDELFLIGASGEWRDAHQDLKKRIIH